MLTMLLLLLLIFSLVLMSLPVELFVFCCGCHVGVVG